MVKYDVLNMADVPFILDKFNVLNEIANVSHQKPDQEQLIKLIPDFDAYFCSLSVQVTKEVIDRAERLKVIVTPSTGLDHINVDYAFNKGIDVISLKTDFELLDQITSTAELAWGLLLGVSRKIPWGFDAVKAGCWARDRYRGNQLNGKTLGILGFGRLGKMMAEYGKAFRMNVLACDIKDFEHTGVKRVDFETLLRQSEVISIHIHLTPENTGLINREAISKMQDGVVVINTSRGAIIDENAFLDALETGKIGAAGVDVINGEWRPDIDRHPLVEYAKKHENLVISPHLGGVTYESQTMAYGHSVNKLYSYLKALRQ